MKCKVSIFYSLIHKTIIYIEVDGAPYNYVLYIASSWRHRKKLSKKLIFLIYRPLRRVEKDWLKNYVINYKSLTCIYTYHDEI